MLSARQANGNEESGGRVAAAAAMATAMAESDGYRQLNGSLSGRPTTAAATLNGHNEPKSKQQIAKPADKSSSSLSSDARNNNNNDDELRPTSETPVGHRHHLRQHSLETGQADNLFGLPVDGDRERRLTSEQQQQQQHFDGDNDTNWRLIGANEGNDANNEQKRKQADEDDERDKGESSEGEPDETRQFIEATEKSAEDKKKAKEKKQDGVGRPAAAPAGGGGGAKKNVSPVWGRKLRAQLAKQESITERGPTGGQQKNTEASKKSLSTGQRDGDEDYDDDDEKNSPNKPSCCSRMLQFVRARKCLTIPLIILVIYIAAIYCLPFIEIDPKIPSELPAIPFDFHEGPLRPSSASAFKFKHLFKDQIHGPESLAFDSQSNLYMAIEGGFILYAHLNRSSPIKRAYLEQPMTAAGAMMLGPGQQQPLRRLLPQTQTNTDTAPELIKIADLNGMRQLSSSSIRSRAQRAEESSPWKRECQLDEKVYGPQLFAIDSVTGSFKSNVRVSRCSKPLGIRLNADESQLYVIDTLTGLYRVNLRSGDNKLRPSASGPRQVFKLIDFRANNGHQVLPAIQLEDEQQAEPGGSPQLGATPQYATRLMNVSMKALDDLVIDTTADNHDLIYMTVASQTWPATSFVFDVLEGRPSGLVLRYNTANNQLVVLEPNRVAHVRTSSLIKRSDDGADERRLNRTLFEGRSYQPSFLLGAPRLDENDIFDDRPLNFPNGLELTDDRQALLIADTSNKRIVRHYVRGPRRGTSDLWAWTPMFPDNIRRGYDKHQETYWVVGCGRAPASSAGGARWASGIIGEEQDLFALLRTWPRLRKFLLKNIYFIGYLVEFFGENLFNSNKIQDAGYELRTGSSLCSTGCTGMMIIQYNRHGDVIRSIHSREFPNDLYYYSQVNELIDPENQEHMLYLGSPSYSYLTKLTLPTESYAAADTNNNNNNNQR